MEQEIRADLPASSPIVAYGATRQPGGKKFLAILAGSFVLVLIGILLYSTFVWRAPLPKDTVFLATIHGGTRLPTGVPAVWERAVAANHPVILGLAKTETGLVPFSIGNETDGMSSERHYGSWPFIVSSDAQLTLDESHRAGDFLHDILHLGKHSAYFFLDPRPFGIDAQEFSGTLDGNVVHTNVALTASNDASLPPGDISVSLDALPDAWPQIRDAIAQTLPSLSLDERPADIGWMMTSGTPMVVANYAATPGTSTLLAFANAAGIYDVTSFTLPDGSVAEELGPAVSELTASGTSSFASTSGTPLLVSGKTIALGPVPGSGNLTNTACVSSPGIFALSPLALEGLLTSWNIPHPAFLAGVRAFVENGQLALTSCPDAR